MKLQRFDSSYFHGKNFFGDDGFQSTLVYKPALDTLELKKDKGNDYVLSWKSKEVFTSKLKPLYTAFLHSIKFCRYKLGRQKVL